MKVFLDHLKSQTIPHDVLEELLNTQVVFYDGCLIVQVHDHKTGAGSMRSKSSGTVGSDLDVPYSIHNYNQHLTPSPYVPYPIQSQTTPDESAKAQPNGSSNGTTSEVDASTAKDKLDKSSHRVFTIVLHPTEQSKYREQCILATTPVPERTGRKAPGRDAPTPVSANGPKPLLSLSMVNGKAAKRPKMYLEENDFHNFEAEYLLATEPPLLLEPAGSLDEAFTILEMLEHPLHTHQPAPAKGRKRTATELAADEAQAAEDERMGLIFDERLQPSLGTRGGDEGAETANTARDFEPNFSRFKKFEEIKARLEEEKKQRAENEAQAQIAKRQHQEQEAQRRQREEADSQQRDLQRQMMKRQMAQRSGQMNGQPLNPLLVQQQMMQAQAQAAGSPIARNQTPTNASSPLMNNVINNQVMAQSMSANSHGSPPRPGSVGNMRQMPAQQMARQASQQQSQQGTPHLPNATPQMGNNMTGRVTPQPGMNAGSPSQMQGTPMMGQGMMGTTQLNGQQAQQRQAYMQQQLAARTHAQQRMASQMQQQQQQQQHMSSSPNPNQFNMQMSPHVQHLMANQQQQQQQQHPQANGQQLQGMGANPQLTAQMSQQMAQQRQSQQYSAQMQARIRQMQIGAQGQGQGQQQANGMANNFQQQQQQQHGGGMSNGVQMQTSMSQHSQNGNAQGQFMQGNQASPNPQQQFQQQQSGLTPQQQASQMAARQQEQQIKNTFFSRLMHSNGGMLPPNANDQYANWRKTQIMQSQQARRAAAAAAAAGQGGMPMPGQGQGGGGVDPAYAQQLERQRQQMIQQQMMRQQQAQQQQRMMNGLPPGQ